MPCWYVMPRWGEEVGGGVGGDSGSRYGVGGREGRQEGRQVKTGLGVGDRRGGGGGGGAGGVLFESRLVWFAMRAKASTATVSTTRDRPSSKRIEVK